MASLCVSCCAYAYTNIFYNGQEHGTSCESNFTGVKVHGWLTADLDVLMCRVLLAMNIAQMLTNNTSLVCSGLSGCMY